MKNLAKALLIYSDIGPEFTKYYSSHSAPFPVEPHVLVQFWCLYDNTVKFAKFLCGIVTATASSHLPKSKWEDLGVC